MLSQAKTSDSSHASRSGIAARGGLVDPTRWAATAWDIWIASWASPEQLLRRCEDRLRDLLLFARENTPLYRTRYAKLPSLARLRLADLPVVRKSDLMADLEASFSDRSIQQSQLEAFLSDHDNIGRAFMGRYAVWTSSGTTGVPGVFLHDAKALAVYEAQELLRFRGLASPANWNMRWAAGERFVMASATGGHFAGVATMQHLRMTYPWLANRVHMLSLMQPLSAQVESLNALQPTVLATYPTAAEVLAEEQSAGRLRVNLNELWTGGESLSPQTRERLQGVFQCRVRHGYGASECMSMAWECRLGHLHLNCDWVMLEPVDHNYQPVPIGAPSHTVLLTNLANRVQPLIRYELGDAVTLQAEPCACGSPFPVIQVEGRRDDVLRFQRHDGAEVRLLPLVLATVLEDEAGVYDFQLLQTAPTELRLRLGLNERVRHAQALAVLRAHLDREGLMQVRLLTDSSLPVACPSSGKLRRVQRQMPKPAEGMQA